MRIQTVIFDLGGVLIDWNPRYLYRKLVQSEAEIEYFLANVCTFAWNAQQDAGRPFREGVALLQAQFPQYAELIEAYHQRWEDMLGGAIWESVTIFRQIKSAGMRFMRSPIGPQKPSLPPKRNLASCKNSTASWFQARRKPRSRTRAFSISCWRDTRSRRAPRFTLTTTPIISLRRNRLACTRFIFKTRRNCGKHCKS